MDFTIQQKDLSAVIQDVQRAVSSHTTMPVLSGVKIDVQEDKIKLAATDLEIGIESQTEGEVKETGVVVLPAQHLGNIIRELPNEKVRLSMKEENSVELKCAGSTYNIRGFPPEDFPSLPQVEEGLSFTMKQGDLKTLIEEVKFAASTDENQPFLHGAQLSINENKMELAATNTYRLAYREMDFPGEPPEEKIEVIIPLKTLQELTRLLESGEKDEVNLTLKGNHLLFSFPPLTITSRLKEGQFPNYREVIPGDFNSVCNIDRNQLLQAVRRASLIAREDSNTVDFEFKEGELIITTKDSRIGQAYEEVAMEKEGSVMKVSFTADYLLDVLKVLRNETVTINLQDESSACVFRSLEDFTYTYVIMPVQN